MALASPRISFNSSRLVRILSDLDIAEFAESKQSFAERLGQWLDLGDAISLSAALKPGAVNGARAPKGPASAGGLPVQEEFTRLRSSLIESIGTADGPMGGNARIKFPTAASGASMDGVADFSPYHRYYLARQRDMDAAIRPLRAKVRAALADFSPGLRQLAAMDAVFEEALHARERNLLMTVSLLLEKRFEHLRGVHLAALGDRPASDDPERWMQPGGWLALFCRDMQCLLLAELDFRLQLVEGLIEALCNEVTKHQ